MPVVGYRFDWGSVILAFRNLSYDRSGDMHLQNVTVVWTQPGGSAGRPAAKASKSST